MFLVKPSLQEGPCVHARRSVTLEINKISGLVTVASAEEMIEADLKERYG